MSQVASGPWTPVPLPVDRRERLSAVPGTAEARRPCGSEGPLTYRPGLDLLVYLLRHVQPNLGAILVIDLLGERNDDGDSGFINQSSLLEAVCRDCMGYLR